MARTDIAGLLTGVPSGGIDPMAVGGTPAQQRLAFGAQRAQGLQRAARGLMGQSRGTPAEQLQMAMAQLDMSNPDDLRKIAEIQQATGDLAGAAQTAATIQAMKQAEIDEKRAADRESRAIAAEIRAQETYEMGKIDRLDTKERQKRSDARQEEQLAMAKLREARAIKAAEKALSDEEKLLAQQGEYRALLVQDALSKGKPELAEKIRTFMDLDKATELLTKTSTALIRPLKSDEKEAYDVILQTPAMQKLLPRALTKGWYGPGTLSDATENAIFLKTKEISTREQLPIEEAMVKAIDVLTELKTVDDEGKEEEPIEVDRRGRPIKPKKQTETQPVDSQSDDDDYGFLDNKG